MFADADDPVLMKLSDDRIIVRGQEAINKFLTQALKRPREDTDTGEQAPKRHHKEEPEPQPERQQPSQKAMSSSSAAAAAAAAAVGTRHNPLIIRATQPAQVNINALASQFLKATQASVASSRSQSKSNAARAPSPGAPAGSAIITLPASSQVQAADDNEE